MSPLKFITVGLSIGAILLFSGCSAKGQKFVEFKKPQENYRMLYVYRPSFTLLNMLDYKIFISNSTMHNFMVGELINGGYVEINLPTGENKIRFAAEDPFFGGSYSSTKVLDLKNEETYCVKVGIPAIGGRPSFELVDMATCKSEIIATKKF
jgi:hypothetical protein